MPLENTLLQKAPNLLRPEDKCRDREKISLNFHGYRCYQYIQELEQEVKLKYSDVVSRKSRRDKDKQIRNQWKREAGPQFGMILEVLPSSFYRKIRKKEAA